MLKLRVGVLEQHNIVRHGLYTHLSRQSVLCLSEFFNFADMLEALEQKQLDVLMIGHLMDREPCHLVRSLSTRYPDLKVLVLLNSPDPAIAAQLQAMGAHGVMSKTQPLPDYVDALRSLARGEHYAMASNGQVNMEKPRYDPQPNRSRSPRFKIFFGKLQDVSCYGEAAGALEYPALVT